MQIRLPSVCDCKTCLASLSTRKGLPVETGGPGLLMHLRRPALKQRGSPGIAGSLREGSDKLLRLSFPPNGLLTNSLCPSCWFKLN